jgi:hypothetical protein
VEAEGYSDSVAKDPFSVMKNYGQNQSEFNQLNKVLVFELLPVLYQYRGRLLGV